MSLLAEWTWLSSVASVGAFLLGSLLGGQILTQRRGLDLRQSGSGNIGATNALRAGGRRLGLAVLAFDAGKGALAVGLLPWLQASDPTLPWACGLAAILGHIYSPWAGFSGGKGAATALGTAGVLLPVGLVVALAGFVAAVVLSGYVSLAMLFAVALLALHTACFSAWSAWSLATAYSLSLFVLLCWTHRDNLRRLWRGQENRFERIMLRRR